jgi:hypothetical protein
MNASGRLNTCKSKGNMVAILMTTGARVRNTYATYLQLENSPSKEGLILHNILERHLSNIKPPGVIDGHAVH